MPTRIQYGNVSTHSRPKAADDHSVIIENNVVFQHTAARRRLLYQLFEIRNLLSFNTQPPEGG